MRLTKRVQDLEKVLAIHAKKLPPHNFPMCRIEEGEDKEFAIARYLKEINMSREEYDELGLGNAPMVQYVSP